MLKLVLGFIIACAFLAENGVVSLEQFDLGMHHAQLEHTHADNPGHDHPEHEGTDCCLVPHFTLFTPVEWSFVPMPQPRDTSFSPYHPSASTSDLSPPLRPPIA